MARSTDPSTPTRLTPTFRTSSADSGQQRQPASGRVAFDERGNAVWEMRTEDHQYCRKGSTTLVRKLKATPLSIEATGIVRRKPVMPDTHQTEMPVPKRAVPEDAGRPLDRAQMGTVRTFPVRTSAAAKRPAARPAAVTKDKPSLLGRLFGRKP
jgi:hypothetical protein